MNLMEGVGENSRAGVSERPLRAYHRMMLMRRIALLGVLFFLSVTPSALASVVLAPPGHDGANQYVEVIPTSGGNAAPPGSVKGSGSPSGSPGALAGLGQGRTTDASLSKMGTNGQAAAALAAATAPAPAGGGSGIAGGPTGGASGVTAGSPSHIRASNGSSGGSAVGGLASALSGSGDGGLGLALPLLLATALVVILGFAGYRVLNARQTPPPSA